MSVAIGFRKTSLVEDSAPQQLCQGMNEQPREFRLHSLIPKQHIVTWITKNDLHFWWLVDCVQKHLNLVVIVSSALVVLLLSGCNSSRANTSTYTLEPIERWTVDDINAVAWSRDNEMFAIAGEENGDSGIYAYRVNGTERLWSRELRNTPFTLTFTPNNQTIFIPLLGGSTFFIDKANGQVVRELDYDVSMPCFDGIMAAFSPNGMKLFTLSTDFNYTTTIYVWNMETNQCDRTFLKDQGVSLGFELSNDGQFLVLGLRDIPTFGSQAERQYQQQIEVWNVMASKRICAFNDASPVTFNPDGNIVAASSVDKEGEVDLWDAKSCKLLYTLNRQGQKGPFSMAFNRDGKLLVVGGSDSIQIWDVENRTIQFESDKLPSRVKILAFSPDGRFLLSGTDKSTVDGKAIITLWRVNQ